MKPERGVAHPSLNTYMHIYVERTVNLLKCDVQINVPVATDSLAW